MPMEVVLDLYFLASQNDPSPPYITGIHIVFTDNIGVGCQDRNRPIRLISQTVVQLVNRLGTLHLASIAGIRPKRVDKMEGGEGGEGWEPGFENGRQASQGLKGCESTIPRVSSMVTRRLEATPLKV